MSKILLLGGGYATEKTSWSRNLKSEGELLEFEIDQIDARDIVIRVDKKETIISPNSDLIDQAEAIILLEERYLHIYRYLMLLFPDKVYLNKNLLDRYPDFPNKFIQAILLRNLTNEIDFDLPATYFTKNPSRLVDVNVSYPLLAKKLMSSGGKGLWLLKSEAALSEYYGEMNADEYEVEEFIHQEDTHDYRTMFVGDNYMGTIVRKPEHGDFKTNAAYNTSKRFELPNEFRNTLLRLFKSLELEYAGIDFAIIDNQLVIYEINAFAAAGLFKKATGVNIHRHLLKHIASKL